MAFNLKDKENLIAEVHYHWLAYTRSGFFFFTGTAFGLIVGETIPGKIASAIMFGLPGLCFLIVQWLRNKSKIYALTNERLFIENGIFSKVQIDVPVHKINDIVVKQSLIERAFGAGTLQVLTGNDKPTTIQNVEDVQSFKEKLSGLAHKTS